MVIMYFIDEHITSKFSFVVPATNEKMDLDQYILLQDKLVLFHEEYISISKKYSIAEIYTDECNEIGTNDSFLENLKVTYDNYGLSLFPNLNPGLNTRFGSKVNYLNKEGEPVSEYCYGIQGGNNFISYDLKKGLEQGYFPDENHISIYTEGTWEIEDAFYTDLEFFIAFHSPLFYPKSDWLNLDLTAKMKDCLHKNIARLNSFLRDLKTVWVDQLNWDFKAFEDDYVTIEGVVFNNEVTYFEDVSNAKVI